MNKNEKQQIINMRTQGLSYKEIGETLNISHNTISAFCKRNVLKRIQFYVKLVTEQFMDTD